MFETPDLAPLATEIFMLIMAIVVLVADLFVKDEQRKLTYWLSQFAMVGAFYITIGQFGAEPVVAYAGTFVLDDMAVLLKLAIFVIGFFVLLYSRPYINSREILRGEYYMLMVFGTLGASILVSAHSFLTIYLGLELLSLSSYALVASYRDSRLASEAAIKYFVMGAMASGFLLYGMSLVYGTTGSIDIDVVSQAITAAPENNLLFAFGLVFMICGMAFKMGAVPFHMWIPDVYQGAPTSVTAFIGSIPKIASFGMLIRLLTQALPELQSHWMMMLIILSVLSMGLGNITAISQSNIKRLLAYSAIAHMGYFLLGIIAGTPEGYSASMFYIIIYALTTIAGFGIIIFMSRAGFECDSLDDFKGLWQRSPWFALMMLMTIMSMAGVPPFIGFWPKLQVILALIHADNGLLWLAVTALVFSIVGAFVYLRIAKVIFFDKPEVDTPLEASMDLKIALSVNGLAMIGLGLFPGLILGYCIQVFA
ncbi:MAG: NADH-quinone oxidoreductase subunit NuoN [Gammaproteobacteria bacterium]|nr:MAG: NADH-quinone oxidoreductase subunit NuoN [Gammaproteobacteria bacterium]